MLDALQNGSQGLFDLISNSFSNFNRASAPATQTECSDDCGVLSPEIAQSQVQETSQSDTSGLSDYVDGLLNSVGLDSFELSPDTSFSLQYARAQFEISYQSISSVNTASGLQTQEFNFSFKGSIEYLNLQVGQGAGVSGASESGETDSLNALMDYFSPEKTAGRILDFALSFFPQSSAFEENGDTETARQSFADLMGGAIQKGFDQAMGILGKLPDPIQEDIDTTHELVFDGLDDFVQNGLNPEKSGENSLYASIQAYQMELSLEMQTTTVEVLSDAGQEADSGISAAPGRVRARERANRPQQAALNAVA